MPITSKAPLLQPETSVEFVKKRGLSSYARTLLALDWYFALGKALGEIKIEPIDKQSQKTIRPLLEVGGMLRQIDTEKLKELQDILPAFESTLKFLAEQIESKLKNSQHSLIVKEPYNAVARDLQELNTSSKNILAETQRLRKERLEALKEIRNNNPETQKKIEALIAFIEKTANQYETVLAKAEGVPKKMETLKKAIDSGLQSEVDKVNLQNRYAAIMQTTSTSIGPPK